jgi:hypothetical protein
MIEARVRLFAGTVLSAALLVARTSAADGPPRADAERAAHTYVIAIGYNGVPASDDSSLQPLRFADDDAIAFFGFLSRSSRRAHLLTAVDADTQRRLGGDVPATHPPTLAEIDAAVADVGARLEEDARTGIPSRVYLYYSGHGTAPNGREPALALADGGLTREVLYDRVLAKLPASQLHVFVDACHAEAVVRPRDADAQVQPTSDSDRAQYLLKGTLARFPNVGAVMAATRSAQAHEWENYLGGVFTHELLSALRGAADVNGDARIEYSELAAFLSAANGSVRDPRARLEAVTHAPDADPRAAIVDLRRWSDAAVLQGHGARLGRVFVEDDRGNRLVDVHAEPGSAILLSVPAASTLYVHTDAGEAVVRAAPGSRIDLDTLTFARARAAARGAVESSLHEGLFATAFGPAYYRGFVDRATDLVAIPPQGAEPGRGDVPATQGGDGSQRAIGWASLGTAGALAIGAGLFGWKALQDRTDYDKTSLQRTATDAATAYTSDTSVAAVLGSTAFVAAAIGAYFLLRSGDDHPTAPPTALRPGGLALAF